MGVSGQGVRKLEQAEADGTITLKTLSRLAHGLDCEVRYILIPRTSLLNQVFTRAKERTSKDDASSPFIRALPNDAESLETLTTLLTELNRRRFW